MEPFVFRARELTVILSVSDGGQKRISTGGKTSSVPVKIFGLEARIIAEIKTPLLSVFVRKCTFIHTCAIKVKNLFRSTTITAESTGSRLDYIERSSTRRIAGIVHHKIRF
jgi:hypothetical protein